jgi:hypothetical protein
MEAVLELITTYLGEITSFIFGVGIIATYFQKFKKLLKEASDVFNTIDKSLEDGSLTVDEIKKIKIESIEVWEAVKAFKKEKPKK